MLSTEQIAEKLTHHRGWEYKDHALVKTYRMHSFGKAIQLVNAVALVAEHMNHHPDMAIKYNHLTFILSTRSASDVTEKDFSLLKEIEKLAVAML